jgi:hypothetical protein
LFFFLFLRALFVLVHLLTAMAHLYVHHQPH